MEGVLDNLISGLEAVPVFDPCTAVYVVPYSLVLSHVFAYDQPVYV